MDRQEKEDNMQCPKCKTEMQHEDAIHRWNIRTHYCTECNFEKDEDITSELIDAAKDRLDYQI
jgi:peptide subunit release factor 1 (eRF1)